MRRLNSREVGPPIDSKGYPFRYLHSNGSWSRAHDWWTWREEIKKKYEANGEPLPSNFMEIAEDQLCGSIPPHLCKYSEGDPPPVDTRISLNAVKNWLLSVARKIARNEEYVAQEEAERRAGICVGCHLNSDVFEHCGGGCQKLVEFLTPGMAARHTQQDGRLRSCAACLCFNAVQVHFPLANLEEDDTPSLQKKLPSFCWKKRGGENYRP